MAKSIPGGVEIVNTLSTKNDGNYPLVKAESVGMADGTTAEDNIKKKLDKNQGTQNNGKFMRVGADGNLVPDDVPIPDVSGQIKEHNENTDSHQDIRTELKKKANSGTTLSDYGITDAVPDSHLTDSKAHEDIRKETAKLKEDLTGLHSSLYAEKSDLKEITNRYNMINPDNVVRGTVNMSGVIIESEYSAYDVIKYISVEAGKTYGMSYKGSAGGRLPLEPDRTVFYNERKEFVEQSTSEGECTNFITKNRPYSKNVYGITAKNNGYLCLQVSHGLQEIMFYSDLSDEYIGVFMQSSNAKIKEAAIHEANLDDDLKMRFKSVNDVNGIMSEVVDSKEIPYNLLNPSKSIKGTLGITGTTSEDLTSPYLVSDYIFLKAGIRYNLSYFNKNYNDRYNLYAGRYCFYDSQTKVFKDQSTDLKESPIPYIEYSVKFGGGGYTLIKPSANVFMKIQYSNDLEKAQIIEGADPTYVESYEPTKKYALRNKIVELNNLSDELRAKIETGATKVTDDIYKLAFCKIHKNVLCIGDSLTEGYHNPDDI